MFATRVLQLINLNNIDLYSNSVTVLAIIYVLIPN